MIADRNPCGRRTGIRGARVAVEAGIGLETAESAPCDGTNPRSAGWTTGAPAQRRRDTKTSAGAPSCVMAFGWRSPARSIRSRKVPAPQSSAAGILGADLVVIAVAGRSRYAIPAAAKIAGGADISVATGSRGKRELARSRRRIAGVHGARIAVLAIDQRGHALTGIAAVLGAGIPVIAGPRRSTARSSGHRLADVLRRARIVIITRGAGSAGSTIALTGRAAGARFEAVSRDIARRAKRRGGALTGTDRVAEIALGAGVSIITRGTGGRLGTLANCRAGAGIAGGA